MTQPDLPDWISTIAVADSPQLLQAETGFHPVHQSPFIDVSPWSSVALITLSQCSNVNTLVDVLVQWFDSGVLIDSEHYTFWSSQIANNPSPQATLNLPCLGNQMMLTFTGSDNTQLIQYSVYGSRRSISKPIIKCDWPNCSPAVLVSTGITVNVGATQTFRFGPTHGPFGYLITIAGSFIGIIYAEVLVNNVFTEPRVVSVSTSNNATGTDVFAPGTALRMDVTNNSTTNNLLTVLVMPIQ